MSDSSTLEGFDWLSYWLVELNRMAKEAPVNEDWLLAAIELRRLMMETLRSQLYMSPAPPMLKGSFTDPHHPHPHCTGVGSDDGGEAADRQFGRDEASEADRRWKMGIK